MIGVFAGTREGRELIQRIQVLDVPVFVSTATEYGTELIESYPLLKKRFGPMDQEEIGEWIQENRIRLVIDATHPYAIEATKNIMRACKYHDISYSRFERPELKLEGMEFFEDYEDCICALKARSGRILLTTGSNRLNEFVEQLPLDRLVVRVLPKSEVMKKCESLGLKAEQVIAVQGPFSEEMNTAILRDYRIEHLVTKESGRVGGLQEKVKAAIEMNVNVLCIQRGERRTKNAWESQECLVVWIKNQIKNKGAEE